MSGLAALVASLPQCAIACILDSVEDSTCASGNQTCVCHDEAFNAQATACVAANCTVREALSTKNLTSTACGIAPETEYYYVPIIIVFITLCAISVTARIFARLQARIPVWWDDFIITLSFLGCIASATIFLTMKPHGLGTDMWAVSFDNITLIIKAQYMLCVFYIASRDLTRLSILLFYHRVFGHMALARRLIYYSFVLIIACGIAFDLAIIFGCTPIEHFWTSWDGEHEGHCISINGIFWSGAIIVIVIDIWIMLLPLPFVLKLSLSPGKKTLSATMFTFGICVVIISFYRLSTINRFTLSQNTTRDCVDVGIWSGIEIYVGIICACLPNFHYLLKSAFKRCSISSLSRTKLSYPTSSDPGGSSGRPHRSDGARSGSEIMIRATTTIDVVESWEDDRVHLRNHGWGDTTESTEGVELGMRKGGNEPEERIAVSRVGVEDERTGTSWLSPY
ncbi:hypothetical protein F4775DRAFT_591328 [Biscogniauxia sp. FL1348]|nr:hypothetical protein F4775DRAFT_591328 [Biscogniauxia sp. FL1348]